MTQRLPATTDSTPKIASPVKVSKQQLVAIGET
jgi:hypothetical protein